MTTTTPTYAICKTRNFYGPMTENSLVTGDSYDALTFETSAEANLYIAELDDAIYYTAHNETGRPEYKAINIAKLPAYLACQL